MVEHYQPDIKKIDDKVQLLAAKAEGMTETLNYKITSFELLQEEGSELAHHLQVLNQNKEFIAQNALDQVKKESRQKALASGMTLKKWPSEPFKSKKHVTKTNKGDRNKCQVEKTF